MRNVGGRIATGLHLHRVTTVNFHFCFKVRISDVDVLRSDKRGQGICIVNGLILHWYANGVSIEDDVLVHLRKVRNVIITESIFYGNGVDPNKVRCHNYFVGKVGIK